MRLDVPRVFWPLALCLAIHSLAQAEPAAPPRPKAMVAAANPAAVEAGLEVLRRGG